MQRSSPMAPCALVGLILAVTGVQSAPPSSHSSNEPANRQIAEERQVAQRPEPATAPLTLRGIQSYGVGAVRSDRAATSLQAGSLEGTSMSQDPSLLTVTRKLSGSPMAGSVAAFRVSPDGATAVFIADKDTLGRFELYSVPASGSSAPVKISAALVFGSGDAGVNSFQISPDSSKVVFLADPNTGGGINEIFSVPINGSTAAVRLNTAGAAPVTGFGITRDNARAVFFGVDTTFGSGAVEVYRAAIGSGSSAVQISDVGQGNAQGDAVAADFSPDSARVVYAADAAADNVFQWYSVPITASGPGSDVQISAALSSVDLIRFSPDSARVAYTADENALRRMEVFSKPAGGGTRIQLNPAMAGDGATDIGISPDGNRVVYLADQITVGVNEIFSAQMLVTGSGTRLNSPMSGSQYTDVMNISPDGSTALYEADQNTPGTYELYRAPIDASSGPSTLHGVTAPADVGSFQGLGTPIIGKRAVYPVFGATVDLFSVPFDSSSPFEQVNDPLAAGDAVFSVFLPFSATRLMAYGLGSSSGTVTRTIVSAPIRGDLPVETINAPAAAGAKGVLGYEITSNERYAVYMQDQDTLGKTELYSRELDSDADGTINAADNCPYIANPSQTPVVFPASVDASNNTTFTWNTLLDVRFVRGPLASVGTYATNLTGTLRETAQYVEADAPASGTGWYYIFAPDCPGRSYQSVLGAEPGRDLAGFP